MRARQPDVAGFVDCDGVQVGYEVFGSGQPAVLLLPTWTIIHSRFWKLQIPFLADTHRVITFDRPGNGRTDHDAKRKAYAPSAVVDQALAVMDAIGTDRAVIASLSMGAQEALMLAATHPDRVVGAIFIGHSLGVDAGHPEVDNAISRFLEPHQDPPEGWDRFNAQFIAEHYKDFAEFFFSQCLPEQHSTKQYEDCLDWAAETTPDAVLTHLGWRISRETVLELAAQVSVPTLVIHGDDDHIRPVASAELLAEKMGGELAVLAGSGHLPFARDPVRVNLLMRDFIDRVGDVQPRDDHHRWTRGAHRPRRALFVSSPIGLGHARRDIAIAGALRQHNPDLEIEWLAQHPVTRMLDDAGERVHPASHRLANESSHMESESGEHRLHCFQAWRRMDEILLADFMAFHDVVNDREYDLVIGDEAWEIDYFLHENPELKRFAYCWLTDFVGWLPMPEGGSREAALTADYNAEMIEHIARYPRVRDLALFVGNARDIVEDDFGAGLPRIRDWTEEHYDFPGYITGPDPNALDDRDALRDELGYREDERVCIVTVGGSGVGVDLLRHVIDAYPAAANAVPGLRMIVVAGPRIDPASLPAHDGLQVESYVPQLHRHLAASDLAVVQGGLTTCMELTAANRPFIYVPLREHFEQNFHVHHRLHGHGAGRRLDFADLERDVLAAAIAAEIDRDVHYRSVELDGAARAAAAISALL